MRLRFVLMLSLLCIFCAQGVIAADFFVVIGGKKEQAQDVASPLPDTGIYFCDDGEDDIICPGYGDEAYAQDGHYNAPERQLEYKDNYDGTVTDKVTGLMWAQGDLGGENTPSEAIAACAASELAGHTDWRLAEINEYVSLYDLGQTPSPLISRVFTFTADASHYWSNTSVSGSYWNAAFENGAVIVAGTSDNNGRCVRGNVLPAPSFTDNGDGTVSDSTTGLEWLQVDDSDYYTWLGALACCRDLDYAGHDDWRLPDYKELHTLLDYDRTTRPSIDEGVFDSNSDLFWSASPFKGGMGYAYSIDFYFRSAALKNMTNLLSVRCVRGGP